MTCEFCELANAVRLYEDDSIVVAIRDHVFTPGQITVLPKEHITILDAVPKDVMEKIALAVNKVSIAAFEGMGSQGTNVLIQNGLAGGQKRPHFSVDIIPDCIVLGFCANIDVVINKIAIIVAIFFITCLFYFY